MVMTRENEYRDEPKEVQQDNVACAQDVDELRDLVQTLQQEQHEIHQLLQSLVSSHNRPDRQAPDARIDQTPDRQPDLWTPATRQDRSHIGILKALPQFDGTATEGTQWLAVVANIFKLEDTPPAQRVPLAALRLQGTAATWWRAWTDPPTTWTAFETEFKKFFVPINHKEECRRRLRTLRQTGTLVSYNQAFQLLVCELPELAPEFFLDFYIDGLASPTHEEVRAKAPDNWFDAMKAAIAYDARRPPRPTPVAHTGTRYSKLTDEERSKLRATGACFFCREPGHMANACPRKRRPPIPTNQVEQRDSLQAGND